MNVNFNGCSAQIYAKTDLNRTLPLKLILQRILSLGHKKNQAKKKCS